MINGNNLVISTDTVEISNLTDVRLDVNIPMVKVTTKRTQGHKQVIPGTPSGNITFNGFYDVTDTISKGDVIRWTLSVPNGTYSGSGYIYLSGITGNTNDAVLKSGVIETIGDVVFTSLDEFTLCIDGDTVCINGDEVTILI